MKGKDYDRRKSKCDKKKKRDVYRHSSKRRYKINEKDKSKRTSYEDSRKES